MTFLPNALTDDDLYSFPARLKFDRKMMGENEFVSWKKGATIPEKDCEQMYNRHYETMFEMFYVGHNRNIANV